MDELGYDDWRSRERDHHQRVDALTAGHLDRRNHGRHHPVEDFLWVYYTLRPGQLRRWHPGAGTLLLDDHAPRGRRTWRHYHHDDQGTSVDVESFRRDRADLLHRIHGLLTATAARPGRFSCYCLHEWAMVYHADPSTRRHEQLPLRLGREGTDAVVDAATLRCSHVDAYRFFTPAARDLNTLHPSRDTQIDHEQPGCLHATMDLYQWAYRLAPAIPSSLTLDCLDLAHDARRLDMAGSPYDVRAWGIQPILVETDEGRAAFASAQQDIARRGAELRARLIRACDALLTVS
ncbi:hypothetical protein KEM60_01981 [Austwickia sp. TVS 96-490-7B]|uniref:3-methyladenine DNA glycosylase n=1 Tax=Austwickia sp. TVS 96-490-7B TaxID=2830843 RepID=UPI001C590BE7|nr:3-methyladenine DNA glycosylase [Austwickia sp. TVS 96-490-7B]MBW3085772.1 hypothetical protein [Austwickia sp. TVS 96-490-7B]